jgi:hypothetical protein
MRKLAFIIATLALSAGSLRAQQTCASYSIVMNTPEDKLMLAVNGASNPQEQAAALVKFAQAHADSKFMPCVDEYLTRAYLKLKQYNKAIAAGQEALAAHYLDMNFVENLLQAYIASGRAGSHAFDLLALARAEIQRESQVARPAGTTDAAWQQMQKQAAATAKNETDYMQYAFFQLLAHVTDPNQRIAALDKFTQAYPGEAQKNAGLLNYQYAIAYTMLNQTEKADSYAEKTLAADPNNVEALNLLAFDYAIQRRTNLDQAAAYAKKVIQLVPAMSKPAGATDAQFQAEQNNLLGVAHLALGYVMLIRASGGKRYATRSQMAPAIRELESANEMLASNPRLDGGALFYLGNAYEEEYPADHRAALDVLSKAAPLQSPWQAPAQELLAKVRRVVH